MPGRAVRSLKTISGPIHYHPLAALRDLAASGLKRSSRAAEASYRSARNETNHLRKLGASDFARLELISRSRSYPQRRGMGLQTRPAMVQGLDSRPTVEDFREDSSWVKLAKTLWLEASSNVRKGKHDIVKKDIWDPLEAQGFDLRSLLTLENLSILEKYYSPGLFQRIES